MFKIFFYTIESCDLCVMITLGILVVLYFILTERGRWIRIVLKWSKLLMLLLYYMTCYKSWFTFILKKNRKENISFSFFYCVQKKNSMESGNIYNNI